MNLAPAVLALTVTSLTYIAPALAQSTPPPGPSTATEAPGATTAPPPAPAAGPATAAPALPAATPAAVPPEEQGRFRWGLGLGLGSFFPGPTTFALGPEIRLGYSLNNTVSIFGLAGAVGGIGFGGSVNANGASAELQAVSYTYLGANVDAMLAGPLFAGGGASIGRGGWGSVAVAASTSGGAQEVVAAGGWMPQLNARIGLAAGSPSPTSPKRSGISVALDLRVLIAPDSASTKQSANTSGGAQQSVTASTTAIGFAPMLLLGIDTR